MFPFDNPDTVVEWDVRPVVENIFVIEAYAVPVVVAYLQVAASFVINDNVVEIVPAGKVPVGRPLLLVGGVTSPIVVVKVKSKLVARFPEASLDLTL